MFYILLGRLAHPVIFFKREEGRKKEACRWSQSFALFEHVEMSRGMCDDTEHVPRKALVYSL